MWYQDILKEFVSASLPSSNVAICYATSARRRPLGETGVGGVRLPGERTATTSSGCRHPPIRHRGWSPAASSRTPPSRTPEKRYKTANWIYFFREYNHDYGPNFYVSTSPDGIHWHGLTNIVDLPSGDAGYISYDENTGKYVGITRSYPILPGFEATWMRARTICWSDDLKSWTRPQLILAPDEHDSPDTQ